MEGSLYVARERYKATPDFDLVLVAYLQDAREQVSEVLQQRCVAFV